MGGHPLDPFWNQDVIYCEGLASCRQCGELTHYVEVNFETPLCSQACVDAMWDEYFDACEVSRLKERIRQLDPMEERTRVPLSGFRAAVCAAVRKELEAEGRTVHHVTMETVLDETTGWTDSRPVDYWYVSKNAPR
jgi:hypothetical protein